MPASAPAQDSISLDSTQIYTPARPVRRYTVGYGPHSIRGPDGRSALAPMLRLQGAWLKHAGFDVGTPVTVRVEAGRLVIEVAAFERVPQAEAFAKIAQVADGDLLRRDLDDIVRHLKRRRSR
jgi:hypothetical protein